MKQISVAQDAARDAIRLKERAERYSLHPNGVKLGGLEMRNFSFSGVFSAACVAMPTSPVSILATRVVSTALLARRACIDANRSDD